MTNLLTEFVTRARDLTPSEQDFVAQAGLDAMETLRDERRWDEQFEGSQNVLSRLADESLSEYRGGRTKKVTG